MFFLSLVKRNPLVWKLIFSPILRKFSTLFWTIRKYKNISFESLTMEVTDKMLLKAFLKVKNFDSAIELGCSYGKRLLSLQKYFPKKSFRRVDVNNSAIKLGMEYIKEKSLPITLERKDLRELDSPELEADIIISSMTFIYIPPEDIKTVLLNIKKRVKKAFILQELNSFKGVIKESFYAYDYKVLLKELGFLEEFEITYKEIDHKPWKREKCYGLQIEGFRKKNNSRTPA